MNIVFMYVTPCSLVRFTGISEKHSASVFRIKEEPCVSSLISFRCSIPELCFRIITVDEDIINLLKPNIY
jgi:hypothetical protein